jgi:hypothetical protein
VHGYLGAQSLEDMVLQALDRFQGVLRPKTNHTELLLEGIKDCPKLQNIYNSLQKDEGNDSSSVKKCDSSAIDLDDATQVQIPGFF